MRLDLFTNQVEGDFGAILKITAYSIKSQYDFCSSNLFWTRNLIESLFYSTKLVENRKLYKNATDLKRTSFSDGEFIN